MRRLFAATLFSLALVGCNGTYISHDTRIPEGGEKVQTWRVRLRPGSDAIVFRNVTEAPVRITRISLYDCSNVMGGCMTVHPDNMVAVPHDTVVGMTVMAADARREFSYRWNFHFEPMADGYRVTTVKP